MIRIDNYPMQTAFFNDMSVNALNIDGNSVDIGTSSIELFVFTPVDDLGNIVEESVCTAYMIGDGSTTPLNGYLGTETELKLPLFYRGKPIIKIGEYAFAYPMENSEIVTDKGIVTSINIPYTYKIIGDHAFENAALETFNSSAVENIGAYAFHNTKLKEIYLRSALTTIGNYAFADIDMNLRYVYFNAPNVSVDMNNWIFGFSGYMGTDENDCVLEIGDDVATLPSFLFNPSLSIYYTQQFRVSKIILNNVTNIGIATFAMALNLHKVDLSKVKIINQLAFAVAQYNLENIDLYSAQIVDTSAFFLCDSLKTAYINKDCTIYNNPSQPTFTSQNMVIYTDAETLPETWDAGLFADKEIVYGVSHDEYLDLINNPIQTYGLRNVSSGLEIDSTREYILSVD